MSEDPLEMLWRIRYADHWASVVHFIRMGGEREHVVEYGGVRGEKTAVDLERRLLGNEYDSPILEPEVLIAREPLQRQHRRICGDFHG